MRRITIGGRQINARILEWLQPTEEPSLRVDLCMGLWAVIVIALMVTR